MGVKTLESYLEPQVSKPHREISSISFGDIEVRSYEMMLGDNPTDSKWIKGIPVLKRQRAETTTTF